MCWGSNEHIQDPELRPVLQDLCEIEKTVQLSIRDSFHFLVLNV